MRCLHCGECCIFFDIPEINKTAGVRCQFLTEDNLCKIWDKPERPKVCWKHDYPASMCPIGLDNMRGNRNET